MVLQAAEPHQEDQEDQVVQRLMVAQEGVVQFQMVMSIIGKTNVNQKLLLQKTF